MAPRKTKRKAAQKRRFSRALKKITSGGSYPVRQGTYGMGRPYYKTRDPEPAPKLPAKIEVQIPPKFLDLMSTYMKTAQEGAKVIQEGARAVDTSAKAGSSVVDFMKKAAPIAGVGLGGAALTAYAVAPDLTSDLASRAASNVMVGTAKTAAKAVVNVATEVATDALQAGKDSVVAVMQAPGNAYEKAVDIIPDSSKVVNWGAGMSVASWMAYAATGLLAAGAQPHIIPP